MRKLQTTQLLKAAGSYGIAVTITADTWLLFLDNSGLLAVESNWYYNVPLAAIGLAGIPVTISLAQRLLDTAYKRPGQITPLVTESNGYTRSIPFNRNGKPGTLLTHVSAAIWGEPDPGPELGVSRQVSWQVPLESGDTVRVGERELQRFIELCDRRKKYKFSMRYWTEKRKPPMPRKKYDGFMHLLTSAGLIEARQSGASGYLVGGLKPRHAMQYLTASTSEYQI